MSRDPWDWGVEDVVEALCSPQGQLRSQHPNLKFKPEELEEALRSNGIDGETLLVALTKDTLKQDLDITSLGLRFKIWKIIESARDTSAKFQTFRGGNSDKFAGSFINDPTLLQAPPTAQSNGLYPPPSAGLESVDLVPVTALEDDAHDQDLPTETSANVKRHRGERVVVEESGRKRRKLTLAPKVGVYLDDHAMSIDSVFFGATPVGAEVDLGVRGRDEEIHREGFFNWTGIGPDSALTHFEHFSAPKSGQSRYVSRLMQKYMLGNNTAKPRYFQNNGAVAVGVQPVPSTSLKSSLPTPSLSVVLNRPDGPVAYRVPAEEWKYDRSYTTEKHKATFAIRRENLQTSKALEDWSFLDKYIVDEDEDDIVPLYGESGSEGSYDSETWEEIEQERLEKENKKASSSLALENVRSIIEDEKTAMEAEWVLKKLPALQGRAWKIWSRSHLQDTLAADLECLEKDRTRLLRRLEKFEENICEMPWIKNSEVKFQCQSLQPTVVDMLVADWTKGLLQQPNAPPRPENPTEGRSRGGYIRPGDLADDEEQLTDSDPDDGFVVDDTRFNGVEIERRMPQIPHDDPGAEDVEMAQGITDKDQLDDISYSDEPLAEAVKPPEVAQANDPTPLELLTATFDPTEEAAVRKPLPQFKVPREIHSNLPTEATEIISLSSSENETCTESRDSGSTKALDVESMTLRQLRRQSWDDVEKEGSVASKLSWIIVRQSDFKDDIQILLDMKTDALMNLIGEAYKSLLGHSYYKIRAMPPDLNVKVKHVFGLALWFIIWSRNRAWSTGSNLHPKGISRPLLESIYADWPTTIEDWRNFTSFVQEKINWMRESEQKKANSRKERGKSTRAHFDSYKVPAAGQSLRERARERQLQAQARREQLQKNLENSSEGGSALDAIVHVAESGECIRVNAHIASRMKPHQLEGVSFMWTEIVASSAVEGCLLAQPMGMGKTMQVIALLLTIAESAKNPIAAVREQIPESLRPTYHMILAPPSLVENWYDELLKWLPSDSTATIGEIHKVTNALAVTERISTVEDWDQQGGVLLLSTSFFRQAILEEPAEDQLPVYSEIASALRTRPSVVVVDEAQELKNAASKLSLAVRQVNTQARIAMTGSPLANNLGEYFNLIDFVASGYLGTMQDFRARYINPITEGQYVDASKSSQRRALKMQKVLTQDLAPKIHRAEIAQLHQQLHGKTEFIIRVHLTDLQLRCYSLYVESIQRHESDVIQMPRLWAFLSILKLLCNHPKCFNDKLLSQDAAGSTNGPETEPLENNVRNASPFETFEKESEALAQNPMALLENDMLRHQLQLLKQPESLNALSLSNKMVLLFQIVKLCLHSREKLLIFSHSIPSMNYIECQLQAVGARTIRIDGSTKAELRQEQTKRFNEGDDQVALISTRAGGVGLNLFGASRVVIFDDWFNPILEQQAIGRAYRIGQTKHVYVYRLVAAGSFEEELQNQALFKVGLANRIVDKKDTIRAASRNARTWLRLPVVSDSEDLSEAANRDGKVLEQMLQDEATAKCFHSIKLGDSFLIEENEELTLEEKQDAQRIIDEEKLRRTDPVAYERMRVEQQAALLRESAAAIREPVGDVALRESTGIATMQPRTMNPRDPRSPLYSPTLTAPAAQMSTAQEILAKLSAAGIVNAAPNPAVALGPQLPPNSAAARGPPTLPERAQIREIIDLTSSPRHDEADMDAWREHASLKQEKQVPLSVDGTMDLKLSQEPQYSDDLTDSNPKKSRQLIIPDTSKSLPVGRYGVDKAAMPEIPPSAPVFKVADLTNATLAGLTHIDRNKLSNKLADQIFNRLDAKTHMQPAKAEEQRTNRRREAVRIERQIFDESRTMDEYQRMMDWTANSWAPRHKESFRIPGKTLLKLSTPFPSPNQQGPSSSAKHQSPNQSEANQFTNNGKPHTPHPETQIPTGPRSQNPPASLAQRSGGRGQPHSPVSYASSSGGRGQPHSPFSYVQGSGGRGQASSTSSSKQRGTRGGIRGGGRGQQHSPVDRNTHSSFLSQHLSMQDERENSKKPQQSSATASERTGDWRNNQISLLTHLCTMAYRKLYQEGLFKVFPTQVVIKQLATQIEERANRAPTEVEYMRRLDPPDKNGLLAHLRNKMPLSFESQGRAEW